MRKLAALSTCLTLLAAGCQLEGGPTTSLPQITTSIPETTTTVPEVTTTVPESTTEAPDPELEKLHFAYLSGLIGVPMDEVDVTQQLLEDAGIGFEPVSLDDVLGEEGLDDPEVQAAREFLAGIIQIYVVSDDQDPLQIAEDIRSENPDLRIAPIHAIGEAGHSGYEAPTDPEPRKGPSIDPPEDSEAADGADLAAVVDSGIYPNAPWLDGSVQFLDPLDLEPTSGDGHSHGTFVSSIIRQLSLKHRITFARAREVPIAELAWSDGEVGPTDLTELSTEIHVAEAILRLVDRHQDEVALVKSLNLSLGGYAITEGPDLWMTTTSLAIDRWLEFFPEATVFAAAGNATVTQSFSPAALPGVTGVGALNDPASGNPVEIVWDQDQNEVPWSNVSSTPRAWTDQLAPGSQLAQYTQPELVACWSGSSFATAVATGLHLRNQSPIPDRRALVENLSYCDDGDVVTAN